MVCFVHFLWYLPKIGLWFAEIATAELVQLQREQIKEHYLLKDITINNDKSAIVDC